MLTFDFQRIFAERGIKNPISELIKLGISQPTAHRLLNNGVQTINLKHLEKICLLLNCTPNDLISWQSAEKEKIPDNHSLNLKRDNSEKPLSEILHSIPIDRLNQIRQILGNKEQAQ